VFTQGHQLLGISGLALLRAGARRSFEGVDARVAEIASVIDSLDQEPFASRRDLPESSVGDGYAGWAESYDQPGNDLIELEEPVVRPLLSALPDGVVLDAACGTGRHAGWLAVAGRAVIGVDGSEAMLAAARARLDSSVDLRHGDLTALPVDDGSCAGAVCALALSHVADLGPAVRELGRVLRPGGRLIVSNPHPFATGVLGWRAVFTDADGQRRMIPEYPHLHGAYIAAFAAAGLVVRRCIEPGLSADAARRRAKGIHEDAYVEALTGIPALIVWEAERV